MPQTPDSEAQKHCDKCSSDKPHSNPYAGTIGIVSIIVALLTGVVLFASAFILKDGDSPSPMQFFLTTFIAILVLAAVVFQIVVSDRQWKSMQEGLKRTDLLLEQSAVAERAYIGLEYIKLLDDLSIHRTPHVKIRVFNGGKTPAWNVRGTVKPVIDTTKTPRVILSEYEVGEDADIQGQTGILPPNKAEKYPDVELGGLSRWKEVFVPVSDEVIPFYVVGGVRYADFQGRRWLFRFIAFYDSSKRGFTECGAETIPDPDAT